MIHKVTVFSFIVRPSLTDIEKVLILFNAMVIEFHICFGKDSGKNGGAKLTWIFSNIFSNFTRIVTIQGIPEATVT